MEPFEQIIELYETRHREAAAAGEALERRSARISLLRLVLFMAAAGCAIAAFAVASISFWWTGMLLLAFLAAAVAHDQVIRRLEKVGWIRAHYEDGLFRLREQWAGRGNTRTDFVARDHLYAADLDIFGEGSLFDLLCTARTRSGESQLAAWISGPSATQDILARQDAVQELRDNVMLREDIHVCAMRMRSLVNPEKLMSWAAAPSPVAASAARGYRIGFALLALLASAAVASCFFLPFGLGILAGVVVVQWVVGRICRRWIDPVVAGVDGPRAQLTVLSCILERFEQLDVKGPLLQELKAALMDGGRASLRVAGLGRLVDRLDWSKNQFFAPFAFLLMWRGHGALALETWRHENGSRIGPWLDAAGRLEALCSLAGFAFEHPDYAFPTMTEGSPRMAGRAVGHPLLPRSSCVRNDVQLGDGLQVHIVSGSNMSGKSTWLRTIGINAVLAMAGAPVCAESLSMTPFAIGSTIRILDSLQKGTSRFYAEIRTLKEIVELSKGSCPLLFLLDEIFHGTNSHDRRIGAEAIIRELVRAGAVGLVTTHDLALAKMVDTMDGRGRNVHFEDSVEEGLLHFDYRLKDGPVTRSNAIELMRSVGLHV